MPSAVTSTASIRKADWSPRCWIREVITGGITTVAIPHPAEQSPAANPRCSVNHRSSTMDRGTMHPRPQLSPPRAELRQ